MKAATYGLKWIAHGAGFSGAYASLDEALAILAANGGQGRIYRAVEYWGPTEYAGDAFLYGLLMDEAERIKNLLPDEKSCAVEALVALAHRIQVAFGELTAAIRDTVEIPTRQAWLTARSAYIAELVADGNTVAHIASAIDLDDLERMLLRVRTVQERASRAATGAKENNA